MPSISSRSAGRPPWEGARSAVRTIPLSISSRVIEVTVAGERPRRLAIDVRAIGPEKPISRRIAARFRSRVRPVAPVRYDIG